MPQDQTNLFGLKKTFRAASRQHRGMRFLAVYLGMAILVGFLALVSLAPQVSEKLGTLSVKKQLQESQAATNINPQGPCKPYGDVNLDTKVNTVDAQLILRNVAGLTTFTEVQKQNADVDANGKVTSVDSLLIQRYISGLITTFPVCSKVVLPSTPVPPATPSNLTVSVSCNYGKPQLTFSWRDNATNETAYYIDINTRAWTSESSPAPWGHQTLAQNSTNFVWNALTPIQITTGDAIIPANNSTYYWRVRSYSANTGLYSPSVYPANSLVPPGTPVKTSTCS